jgi:hypothetical protein
MLKVKVPIISLGPRNDSALYSAGRRKVMSEALQEEGYCGAGCIGIQVVTSIRILIY